MDTVINDFVQVLRRHGLRVSPAESLDALHALGQVGLGEHGVARDTLRTTLVKNLEDIETFDRLFDVYFSLRPQQERPRAKLDVHDHDHDHGQPTSMEFGEDAGGEAPDSEEHSHEDKENTDFRKYFDEDRMRPSEDIHGEADKMRLSMFSQELILNRNPGALNQALQRITHQLRLRRARNMFNPGDLVTHGQGQELPLDVSAADLQGLLDHLHDMDVDEALIRQLEEQSEEILRGLPQLIEQMVERQKKLEKKKDDSALMRRSLRKVFEFSPAEQRETEAAIRRMARQIHGAKTRRLKQDRTGHISVPHTLRRNVRYDGIPFDPVLRRHHEKRPRIAMLCDVSLSTRNLSRFWLHMVYQMQNLFSKVRTFVFVAEMAEVTQVFEESSMDRAVEQVFSGRVIDADVNSDFGSAAEQFKNRYLPTINHRTTLVVLGDGRNNGKDPNVAAFEEISQHVRQVIWITPEPRWGWSLGSCDMPLYEPLCDRVEVVRTVDQLAGVAEDLVRTRA
ncbi:VWA domain-containing protein [Rubrobacter tropicus]|uniref:VWA domain-containing protein n=1 Tax=Rubrobacter tropicus TaxID=2653851 RepID=A0A6G8QEG0_9ACTN|nr:VWA domain-containing protein [Rubrobacter tropicus]QIN84828.1 VWA domain-containing protein [Rubrobacter tropicus]